MPFGSYKTLGDTARAFQIVCRRENFVEPLPLAVSDSLRECLNFGLKYVGFRSSEFSACENFIYPILREVWQNYVADFMLWSHEPLYCDTELCGTPDYFLARRSTLGQDVPDMPYLMVIEAKRDDFVSGWGQCLAAMVAALKLNQLPEQTLYGIATNGLTWEFGKLRGTEFTWDLRPITQANLDQLLGAVHFMFEQCKQQLVAFAKTA